MTCRESIKHILNKCDLLQGAVCAAFAFVCVSNEGGSTDINLHAYFLILSLRIQIITCPLVFDIITLCHSLANVNICIIPQERHHFPV